MPNAVDELTGLAWRRSYDKNVCPWGEGLSSPIVVRGGWEGVLWVGGCRVDEMGGSGRGRVGVALWYALLQKNWKDGRKKRRWWWWWWWWYDEKKKTRNETSLLFAASSQPQSQSTKLAVPSCIFTDSLIQPHGYRVTHLGVTSIVCWMLMRRVWCCTGGGCVV